MSTTPTKRKADNDNDDNNNSNNEEYVPTSTNYIPRYAGPPEGELTEQQIEIRNAILKSRPRTGLSGPFGPWLAVPNIAQPAQALGKACRYDTSLSMAESELVILLTGAKTKSHAEFDIHVGEALKSGLTLDVVKAIPRDDEFSVDAVKDQLIPVLEKTRSAQEFSREKAIALFTAELVHNYKVSDETYNATKEALGGNDSVLVEITSISGYYTFVSYTLNVFQIPSK